MIALVVTLTGDDTDDSARDPGQDSSQTPTDPVSASDSASDGATDQGGSPSPAPDSSAPSDGPTSTSADGRMTGTLHSYQLPSGWTDITQDLADQPTVDTVPGAGAGLSSPPESLLVHR